METQTPKDRRPALPDGLVWRGDVIHIDTGVGKRRIRRSTGTDNIAQAREQLDTLRGSLRIADLTGITAKALRPRIRVTDHITQVLAELQADGAATATIRRYRGPMSGFLAFLKREIGPDPALVDISHEVVLAYKRHLQQTPRTRNGSKNGRRRFPSPRTVANELDILRRFLRHAVQRGHLDHNPEEGIGRPKGAYRNRVIWLSDEDEQRLLAAADSWDDWHQAYQLRGPIMGLLIRFYLLTGLRSEELRNLTVADASVLTAGGHHLLAIRERELAHTVLLPCPAAKTEAWMAGKPCAGLRPAPPELKDLHPSAWRCLEDKDLIEAHLTHHWQPKTSERRVPLGNRAREVLELILAWRQRTLASDHPACRARAELGHDDPPWLIPDPSGLTWRWRMPTVMSACCRHAGISPPICTHGLRHAFATRLRQAGVGLETLKELLGHANLKETEIYARYQDAEGAQAVSLLDDRRPPAPHDARVAPRPSA